MKKTKALLLFSGGLDSILAAKVLEEQGIEVIPVFFVTNFCLPQLPRQSAQSIGFQLREEDISPEFLEVLKNPKHGYGSGLNPCIDCHALMLKTAARIMKDEEFDLVATGEVLNERPMSQHREALKIVEREAGLEGYLLRPLSAKLLEPTEPEKDGRVDREKLLDISGRNRKPQMALAEKYSIKEYPTPAGGCALTQEGFAGRMEELMQHKPDFGVLDAKLAGLGRHFWLATAEPQGGDGEHFIQIILGRNREENEILDQSAQKGDYLIEPDGFIGPSALVRGGNDENVQRAKELIIEFSPKAKGRASLKFKAKKI